MMNEVLGRTCGFPVYRSLHPTSYTGTLSPLHDRNPLVLPRTEQAGPCRGLSAFRRKGADVKTIELTQGQVALVDDEDWEWLSQWKWCAQYNAAAGVFYAVHRDSNRQGILMHRLIMNAPAKIEVDHRNHTTLDNQKKNLRLCTRAQNAGNSRGRRDRRQLYKGVMRVTAKGLIHPRWAARIAHEYLGCFKTPEEAARAYDIAAKARWGEFAFLNGV